VGYQQVMRVLKGPIIFRYLGQNAPHVTMSCQPDADIVIGISALYTSAFDPPGSWGFYRQFSTRASSGAVNHLIGPFAVIEGAVVVFTATPFYVEVVKGRVVNPRTT